MDQIMNDFKAYINDKGITTKDAAAELGCDRSTLSKIFSGTYASDYSPIRNKAQQMMENPSAKVPDVSYDLHSMFMTADSKQILAICDMCHEEKLIGAIVGLSGNGKSFTLKNYQRSNEKVAYVECDASMTSKDLMTSLEYSLGLTMHSGTLSSRANAIKAYFESHPGYLLIVDEADKLITRDTIKKIEILRNLHDQVDEYGEHYFGLIIAGEPDLMSLLRQHNERMRNRIDMLAKLDGLSHKEVLSYLEHVGITDVTEKAVNELVCRGTNIGKGGCFRLLHRTLKNVVRVAKGGSITSDHVEQASRMMYEV